MTNQKVNRRKFLQVSGAGLAGLAGVTVLPPSGNAATDTKSSAIKVRAAYFSPTEGTRNVIAFISNSITPHPEYIDLTLFQNRQKKINFSRNELAIVAAPAYAGQIPLVEGLFTNLAGDQTPSVVVCAFGNRHFDDVLSQLKAIMTKQGFVVIAAIGCITPHVFSEKLGHNRPNVDDRIVIDQFASKVAKKFMAGDFSVPTIPGQENPAPKVIKAATKIYTKGNCTNCGQCAEKCPVQAINPKNIADLDEKKCIHCQRCTFVCNYNARSYDPSGVKGYLESHYFARKEIQYFI